MSSQLDFAGEMYGRGKRMRPDTHRALLDLVNELQSGELLIPEHQRSPDAWPFKKKQAWIDRWIAVDANRQDPPLGTICVYDIESEKSGHYLNDGLQRVKASADAIDDCANYGFRDPATVKALLRKSHVLVQYRTYETHVAAAVDFEAVNNGTGLHKSEKYKHHMVHSNGWRAWKPAFEKFGTELSKLISSYSKEGRNIHGRERSNRHLFAVATVGRPAAGNADSPEVEKACAEAFETLPPSAIDSVISRLELYSSEIEHAWRDTHKDWQNQMSEVVARWCIGVMFLHRERLTPFGWQEFLVPLFKIVRNGAVFVSMGDQKSVSVNLTSQFSHFGIVARELGVSMKEKERRSRPKGTKRGFNVDHVMPFCDYGDDGKKQVLPARLNAAKCAREVIA